MATIDELMASKADKYKKRVAGAFVLVDGDSITSKIHGEDFLVTKKLDGVMLLVFMADGKLKGVTRNGTIISDIPVLEMAKSLIEKAGVGEIVFAAELYVPHADGKRERVGEVSSALAKDPASLSIAPFDILEIDDKIWEPEHYRKTLEELSRIFDDKSVRPVESNEAHSKEDIKKIYDNWVTGEGAEGVVVHSNAPIVYKVKPTHTFDAAVLGFTTQDDDDTQVRSMLYGMMLPDGKWQLIGTSGMGLPSKMRKDLFKLLKDTGVETEYIVTDSRGIAYRMVRPERVMELSAIDLVTESPVGEPKMNTVLTYDPEKGYLAKGSTAGVSVLSMVPQGLREDKKPDETDVRISQLTDLVEFAKDCSVPLEELPKSQILARRVYTKGAGAKLMVHKFIVFKTNKEQSGKYPAYVLHHTDFSCGRKEPLKRDLRVSSSREQIFKLLDEFIADNIKKGWAEVQ